MIITDICRETIPVVEFNESLSSLADEAEEVLGYSRLKQEKEDKVERPPLLGKLAALQIEILKTSDVEKYKKERLVEHTKERLSQWIAEPASSFMGPRWNRVKIADYKDPIPEFVLNKAIQVKRAIPDALIFVESLEDYSDPFLVIASKHPSYSSLTEEEYWVEVWAEPRFEVQI